MVSVATTITNMAQDTDPPIQWDLEVLIHRSVRPEDSIHHPEVHILHQEDILQVNAHLQEDIRVAPPILPAVSTRRPTADIVHSCIRKGFVGATRKLDELSYDQTAC